MSEQKEKIRIQCKSEYIESLKNNKWLKEQLKNAQETEKREIARIKEECKKQIERAKKVTAEFRMELKSKREKAKNPDLAYSEYVEDNKRIWAEYEVVRETEKEYTERKLLKIQEEKEWWANRKCGNVPAFLINEEIELQKKLNSLRGVKA